MGLATPWGSRTAPQRLLIGQRIWYAFHYGGNRSALRIEMNVSPPDAATFALWTPDNVLEWQHGNPEKPIGRGAPDPERDNVQVLVGSFDLSGTFYVVVDGSGPYPSTFTLSVTGSGVSPAGS